jgi:hypothetical protein
MAFDKSLDKELFSESIEFSGSKIIVAVYSYNNATPKLQISRENIEGSPFQFSKLGRMTKEEVEKVIPVMQKAMAKME